MKTKTFSIVVSCLFVSNFFIELQAKTLPGFGLQELSPQTGGLRSKRSASEPLLDLTLSADDEILIVRNTTSNRAILIDAQQEIVLLLDGSSSSGVIINQKTNVPTLIPDGLWNATEQSLTKYLTSIIKNDISSLLPKPSCLDFTLPEVPLNILLEISLIVKDLVVTLDPELEQRPELALELVLSIATSIEDLLKGLLDGLWERIGIQQIELAVDIPGVLNILEALEVIQDALQISITGLAERNCNLDIGQILGARDGLSALTQVLRQLGNTIDLTPLNEVLGDPEKLTKLIAQFGGERSVGITGVFRVVAEIIALANNNSSLARVITILITVVAQSNEEIQGDLSNILKNSLSNLLEILKQINCTESLKGLVIIVKDMLDEKFIIDKVNISNIISLILSSAVQPKEKLLSIVVKILKSLDPIVEPSKCMVQLLLVIIVQLDSACGIRTLVLLGLDLGASGCACSLLQIGLASASNLTEGLSQEIYDACSNLPIIRNIIVALEVAISAENLSLKELLNASDFVQNLIKGVFQLVSAVELKIEREILDQAKEVLKNCNGLRTLVEVDVTVTISVRSN